MQEFMVERTTKHTGRLVMHFFEMTNLFTSSKCKAHTTRGKTKNKYKTAPHICGTAHP